MSEKIAESAERVGHTPGPWKRGECDSWIIWAPRFGATDWVPKGAVLGEPETVVVSVIEAKAWAMTTLHSAERDAWLAESDANASLIAAAPDMLEELRACALILPRYRVAGKSAGEDEELAAVLERVEEAIAKAEARS